MDAHLRNRIWWIGGSPCAGKSTIAEALAARHGWQIYECDDAYYRHQELVEPDRQPVFARLSRASCDEIWLRPVEQQIAEELALYREEFPFIVDDLARLVADGPVIAEGAALLPNLIDELGVLPNRAVWIVPTETFQREHYARREWRHDVLAPCSDPMLAWENWMARDAGFAATVAAEALCRDRPVLTTDGSRSIAEMIETVARWFEDRGQNSQPNRL